MPKTSSLIHIRVDTQEERSEIPRLLAAMPSVQIEKVQLLMGDYDVGGDPHRVIERKSASDFLLSIESGRLFEQLTALQNSEFAPLLLLEGDPLSMSRTKMRPEAIRGALTYIAGVLHIPILPSSGHTNSAFLLYSLAKQCQVGYTTPGPTAGRRTASLSEQQMQVLLSLPGIGPTTARALSARFASLHELLNADSKALAAVPGISSTRATALIHLLNAAFPVRENEGNGEA